MKTDNLLEITALNISYHDTTAVSNLCFSLRKGQIAGIAGASGCGKSSLLKAIAGLLPASGLITGGDILFQGHSILTSPSYMQQKIRGTKISMISQNASSSLTPTRTIAHHFEDVVRSHKHQTRTEIRKDALELLTRLELPEPERVLKSYPFQLSGGMNQRICIALSLILKPDLLLADEPTSALDTLTQYETVQQLQKIRTLYGTSILIVSHNIGLLSYLADTIGIMQDGRLIEYGKKDQIFHTPAQPYTRQLIADTPQLSSRKDAIG